MPEVILRRWPIVIFSFCLSVILKESGRNEYAKLSKLTLILSGSVPFLLSSKSRPQAIPVNDFVQDHTSNRLPGSVMKL